jgi:hypothetical protein
MTLYSYRTHSQRRPIVVNLTDEQALSRLEQGLNIRPLNPLNPPRKEIAVTTTETAPKAEAPAPKRETFSHADCSHERTSKARKICREERAKAPAQPAAEKKPAAKKSTKEAVTSAA